MATTQPPVSTESTIATSTPATLTATESKVVKPGYKTTEFWLTFLATLLSMAYASGVIAPDGTSTAAKAIALLAGALTSMGYAVARGIAKK